MLPASCLPASWPHRLLPRWAVFPKRGDKVVLISRPQDVLALQPYAKQPSTLVAIKAEGAKGNEPMAGVYRLPFQTLAATRNLSHPMELHLPVPDLLVRAVVNVLRVGPAHLAFHRTSVLQKIMARSKALKQEHRFEVQADWRW